jgi:hypothetical protein
MTPVTVPVPVVDAAARWADALDQLEAQLDGVAAVASLDELVAVNADTADLAALGPLPTKLAARARALNHRLVLVHAELTQARDTVAGELAGLTRPARTTVSPEPAHLDEWG